MISLFLNAEKIVKALSFTFLIDEMNAENYINSKKKFFLPEE